MLPVSFLPAAAKDLRAIHNWYEEERTGLGKEFTSETLYQIEELQKNTIAHRFFFDNIRYVKLKKFPFSIFYFFDDKNERIIIAAILHNKRDMLNIIKNRI